MKAEREAPKPLAPPGLWRQVWLLLNRFVRISVRNPAVPIVNFATAAFFLIAYDGGLGGSDQVVRITGGNYANFILPVAVLFVGFAGGTAGSLLLEDINSGYFRRQLSMPLSRFAIVLAPILLGAGMVVIQASLIMLFGILILGGDPATGAGGVLAVIALSLIWGTGFAGYSVAAGLRTGNAFAAQAASLIAFPLVFLSPIFVPKDELKEWMQVIATVNPTTYVLDGMRSLIIRGWELDSLIEAAAAAAGFAALAMVLAVSVARRATRRS
jgi:ABC-2 type transport system permease protein